MSLTREQAGKIRAVFQDDLRDPQSSEILVRNCLSYLGKDAVFWEFLQAKIQQEKLLEAVESQAQWFQGLSWWLAKLYMWGTLIFALVLFGILGRSVVDPVTYGIIGAGTYYVLIQVFTPMRLRRQKMHLLKTNQDVTTRMREKFQELEKEFPDTC